MARALSSLCLLIALLASGTATAGGKGKIAILGLEVKGSSTTIDSESTRVAQDLTVALRTRPKAGQGPYAWTPGSEKELVDEKIMASCTSEATNCMAQIATNLGADYLAWGYIERKSQGGQAGYQIGLKLLKVKDQTMLPGWTEFIPLSEASGTKLQDWARKGYKKLTNDFDGGVLRIKVTNEGFDRGTILVDGEERGNITGGVGEVPALPEGRYKISVVATGYERWDSSEKITIRNGDTATEEITLRRGKITSCDPMVSKDCGGTVSQDSGSHSGLWKGVMVTGIVIGLGGGAFGIVKFKSYHDIQDCKDPKATNAPCKDFASADDATFRAKRDDKGNKEANLATLGGIVAGVGGAIALTGLLKAFVLTGGKERVASRSRKRSDTLVIAPIISADGGGATLHLRW